MFRSTRSLLRCAALALLVLPGLGHAFTACVGTAQELSDAMAQVYTTTDASTTIQIREGTYTTGSGTDFYVRMAHSNQTVTLSGGWSTGCGSHRYGAKGTTLIGNVGKAALLFDTGIGTASNTINATDLTLQNPDGIDTTAGSCLYATLSGDSTVRMYRMVLEQCVGKTAADLQNLGGTLTFANSVVGGNYISYAPVSLEAYPYSATQLAQLTIAGNTATSAGQVASGLSLYSRPPQVGQAAQITLINSVVWGAIAPAGIPDIATNGPGITFTRVHYETRSSLNAAIVDNSPSHGDPGFLSPTNPRLRRTSLLVDSGVATFVGGTLDADGTTRMQGAAVDVGAYEANPDRLFGDGFNQ